MTPTVTRLPIPATVGAHPREPSMAVIVPTYGRPGALGKCLRALAAQTLGADRFEVIVCDDGSATSVAAQHAGLLAELSGWLQGWVLRQDDNAGAAAARNLGAAWARARYLAFTDDDCEPAPDWLERLLARFDGSPDVLLGGGLRIDADADPYAAATQAIMDFVYAEQERQAGPRLFSTSNLSLPADGFRAIGGFSPQFPAAAGEDYDLCWRWQESGRRAEYAPEAAIVHRHALTLGTYLQQHYNYGGGLLRVRRRRGARRRPVPVRRPEFYVRLVLHPLRRWWDMASWRRAALIGMSQAATAAGAAMELRPSRRRPAPGVARSTAEPI